MQKVALISAVAVMFFGSTALAQELSSQVQPTLPQADVEERSSGGGVEAYAVAEKADRFTVTALKTDRGTTKPINMDKLTKFCGDIDGCEIRLGMHNWDDTGRVASRSALFYYNKQNRAWRSEFGDWAGTDANNVTQHAMNAWSCYFTDGEYAAWADKGDGAAGFNLLSWNQYNADCFLTVID